MKQHRLETRSKNNKHMRKDAEQKMQHKHQQNNEETLEQNEAHTHEVRFNKEGQKHE